MNFNAYKPVPESTKPTVVYKVIMMVEVEVNIDLSANDDRYQGPDNARRSALSIVDDTLASNRKIRSTGGVGGITVTKTVIL